MVSKTIFVRWLKPSLVEASDILVSLWEVLLPLPVPLVLLVRIAPARIFATEVLIGLILSRVSKISLLKISLIIWQILIWLSLLVEIRIEVFPFVVRAWVLKIVSALVSRLLVLKSRLLKAVVV